MADVVIPYLIEIPLQTAASLTFDGAVTARDISYAISTACLAARAGESGVVKINDNGLRAALGRKRRDRVDVEVGRIERAGLTRITTDEIAGQGDESVGMPTQPVWKRLDGSPDPDRHHPAGGDLKWIVDEKLASAFRVDDGVQTVEFPSRILQFARSRYSAIVMMRLLAILAGWGDTRWRHQSNKNHHVFRLPIAAVREILALPATTRPAIIMRDVLAPAAREITELVEGYSVDIYPRETGARPATPNRAAIRSHVSGFEFLVTVDRVSEPRVEFAGKLEPVKGWHHPKPPRRSPLPRPKLPAARPSTVTPFRRPASSLNRSTIPPPPADLNDDDVPF